jgi:N utilization substance protein B
MHNNSDPRHNSRVITLQRLFQEEFKNRHMTEEYEDYPVNTLEEIDEIKNYDTDLSKILLEGVRENLTRIDGIISKLAPEWPINKIAVIDLLILRIAILEGFLLKITPPKVVINEAIELAKDFSNEQTRKFVSGVLGNIYLNQDKYLNDHE